jgi:hypothetical protein
MGSTFRNLDSFCCFFFLQSLCHYGLDGPEVGGELGAGNVVVLDPAVAFDTTMAG